MTEFCSIDRVTYPLPCQQSYMRWSAHSLPPLDTVSQALTDAGFLPGEQPELYAAPADTPLVLAAGKACVCCR